MPRQPRHDLPPAWPWPPPSPPARRRCWSRCCCCPASPCCSASTSGASAGATRTAATPLQPMGATPCWWGTRPSCGRRALTRSHRGLWMPPSSPQQWTTLPALPATAEGPRGRRPPSRCRTSPPSCPTCCRRTPANRRSRRAGRSWRTRARTRTTKALAESCPTARPPTS